MDLVWNYYIVREKQVAGQADRESGVDYVGITSQIQYWWEYLSALKRMWELLTFSELEYIKQFVEYWIAEYAVN